MSIHIEAGSHGLTPGIGTQRVRQDREAAILHDLAAGRDGTTWSQVVLRVAEGSTVRTVVAHRHGEHVTVAIGLDDEYDVALTTSVTLARAMRDVTSAGAR